MTEPSAWLEPWEPVDESDPLLVAELTRELSPSHPLFGGSFRLIARGKDDDALFAIEDGGRRVAAVHLTWSGVPESAPWPSAELFVSLDDFFVRRMRADHAALFPTDRRAAAGLPARGAVRARPRISVLWAGLVSLVASVTALVWQWQVALRGGSYSIKLVVLATAFVVVLVLTPAALRIRRRLSGQDPERHGGALVAALAALGVLLGFGHWLALAHVSDLRATAREGAAVQGAIGRHARDVHESTVPLTSPP